MTELKLSQKDTGTLERQTNLALKELKLARVNDSPLDYGVVAGMYDSVGRTISKIAGNNFIEWNRQTDDRAKLLDKYVVQHIVGHKAAYYYANPNFLYNINDKKKNKEEISKAKENIEKISDLKVSYKCIRDYAETLARAGEIDLLINALEKINKLDPPKPNK